MSKFETVKTLMYQYLIEELEEDIRLTKQRVEMLEANSDLKNVMFEQKEVLRLEEQLKHLQKYLEIEEKSQCNRPSCIEISYFDSFANKKTTKELNSVQLDGEEYYFKSTGIKLKYWKELEEGILYIISNLTLKVDNEVLWGKYPQETMWYQLDEKFEADIGIFNRYGDKEVYFKD